MIGLSETDKKIVYELGRYARQSYKEIGQKLRIKKETVAYHVSRLVRDGSITKFIPVLSFTKLGVYAFKIYLKLHGLTKEAEKEMYSMLIQNKDICWVANAVGEWDLLIGIYSTDIVSFSRKKDEIISKLGSYIAGYSITMIEDAIVFNRDYLITEKTPLREQFVFSGKQKEKTALGEDEKKLLNLISSDGRFQIIGLAEKIGEDPRTALSKIKKLEKTSVIQGYTVLLDLKKLGYQLHKLCIYLGNYEKEEVQNLIGFFKHNPNLIHIIKSIGSWDLEVEIESDNLNSIYTYIKELKNNFPHTIKKIDLVTIIDEPKLVFYPENI